LNCNNLQHFLQLGVANCSGIAKGKDLLDVYRIGGIALFLLVSPAIVAAQQVPPVESPARSWAKESYGGLVANQTVTVAGQDFFQYFVSAWRDRDLSERYAISVHERPSARWGTQVWIEYAQRRIFQAALPTARSGIRELGEQAVELVYQKIADTEVERLLFRDVDLGPDEM
jgi:curli production assembly/transport component CsgE